MKFRNILLTGLAGLIVTACSGFNGDEGVLKLDLGGNSKGYSLSAVQENWPPEDGIIEQLTYKITLSGSSQTLNIDVKEGDSLKWSLEVGYWSVNVDAYYLGEHFATGSNSTEIKSGQISYVIVDMDKSDIRFFSVANAVQWIDTLSEIQSGGNGKNYVIDIAAGFALPGNAWGNGNAPNFGAISGIKVTIRGDYTLSLNSAGCFLHIAGGQTVIMQDLDIKGFSTNDCSPIYVGGSGASFTMKGSASVSDNIIMTSGDGGGVFVNTGAAFIMQDNSSVYNNTAGAQGGGVFVDGAFTMKDNASVADNMAAYDGGGVFVDGGGKFNIIDGTVYGNESDRGAHSNNAAGSGAALYVATGGAATYGSAGIPFGSGTYFIDNTITGRNYFTVSDISEWDAVKAAIVNGGNNKTYNITVTGNFSVPGSITPTFGNVTGLNVIICGTSTLTLSSAGNLFYIGSNQTVIMRDLNLVGCNLNITGVVEVNGSGSSFTMDGASSISGNTANSYDTNSDTGGGVSVIDGFFTMKENASVFGNEVSYTGSLCSGGVYVERGAFTMQDNAIVHANSAAGGGGVSLADSTFIMESGSVHNNTATMDGGGGVCVGSNSTFIMNGGTISGNTANAGGGVYIVTYSASVGDGKFYLYGGTVYGSNASTTELCNNVFSNGASLYIGSGSLAVYGPSDTPFIGSFIENTITANGVMP